MNRPQLYALLLLALLGLTACNGDDDYLPSYQSEMVVEGWIEDGGFPMVMVSRTYPVKESNTSKEELEDYILRWARVTVTCEGRTVVLTGIPDNRYFPPYIYTTAWMRGKAGKEYTLTVDYNGMHAEATTKVLPAPQLNGLRAVPVAGEDGFYSIKATFTDPYFERNFYQFFVKKGKNTRQYQAAYLGSVDDTGLTGLSEHTVNYGRTFKDRDSYKPYFQSGDTAYVKLAQVDELSYNYWSEFDKNILLGHSTLFPKTTNLPSNVDGAIGYWCGMGSTTRTLIIP